MLPLRRCLPNLSWCKLPCTSRLSPAISRPLSSSARHCFFALYDVNDHNEDLQDNLRLTPKMPTPGLMFVTSRPLDSSKSADEKYNRMYATNRCPCIYQQ